MNSTTSQTPTPTPVPVETIVPTTDYETETEFPLSLRQQKALAITPKVFSFLSILGSLYIIIDVIRLPSNKRKIYHRILLGMSVSDCISSFAFFMSTWPIPSDIWPIYGASGTQRTCSAQGFFVQTSIATCLYSGFLAVYYYFVLLKGWSSYRIEQSQMEYIMHTIVIVVALGTSVAAISMGLFNPNIWDCWIASVPFGCDESWLPTTNDDSGDSQVNCRRGDNAKLYRWVFFYMPLWIIIITVTIIMVLIVCKFQKQERINRKWRSRVPTGTAASGGIPGCGFGGSSSCTAPHHRRQQRRGGTIHKSILQSRRNPVKEIGMQCIFYVGSFYLTWIFPSILRITELVDGNNNNNNIHYHWVLLTATFIPCQGIFNLIVYLRPQFVQIKHKRQKQEELKRKKKKEQVFAGAAAAAITTTSGTTTSAAGVEVEGGREEAGGVGGVDNNNIKKWTATTTSTATDNDYNNGVPLSTAEDDIITTTTTTTANSSSNNNKDSVSEPQQQDQVPPPPQQQQPLFGQPTKSPTTSRKRLSLLEDDDDDESSSFVDSTFAPLPTADSIAPPPTLPAQHKMPILVEDEDAQMEPVPPPPEPLQREQTSFLSLYFFKRPAQQLPSIRPVMTKQGSRMLNLLQDIGEALQIGDGGTGGRTSLLDDVDDLSLHERHARYSVEDDGDGGGSGYNNSIEMLQPSTTTMMMTTPTMTSRGRPDSSGDDDCAGPPSFTRISRGHLRNSADSSPPAVGSGQQSQSQQDVEDAATTTATTLADNGQLKHKPTPFRAASIGRMFSSRKVMGKSSLSLPAVGEENEDEE